ncbi:hypothetical protein [Streptomyces sp. TP-A0874]|uniref:hypothetical protein n=1 Tax=Streptomyces sp. TP-A0874 TaxID=549819 RepID=UPI000853831D|nr:hypothetical protein [Streptomyces sp. TP-A0874]
MRPAHETTARQQSPTPIYDALYAEYRRSFRALPGDRTGEEELKFSPFNSEERQGSWERARSWERDGATEKSGRRHRRNPRAALPPGSRDSGRGRER